MAEVKTALVVGNGASLNQYREYIIYNQWDIRIGTKLQFEDPDFEFDYITAADEPPVLYLLEKYPDWENRIITRQIWRSKHRMSGKAPNLLCPETFHKGDVSGTIGVKWAIEQGATHITTVAMDSLAGEWAKNTVWEWSGKIDEQVFKPDRLKAKRAGLLNTWGNQLRELERIHPEIHWNHRHIGNINA